MIVNRRRFLLDLSYSAGALLALSSCAPLLQNTQFADALINDKPTSQLSPIVQALIATLLPMDDELFKGLPLSYYEGLLVKEFDIYTRNELLFYRKALTVFNTPHLFNVYPQQLLKLEQGITDAALERDRANFLAWSPNWDQDKVFSELPDGPRQGYLRLWIQSPLNYKKVFFRVSKSLVYAAVFSQERFASALGYEGPLLQGET